MWTEYKKWLQETKFKEHKDSFRCFYSATREDYWKVSPEKIYEIYEVLKREMGVE